MNAINLNKSIHADILEFLATNKEYHLHSSVLTAFAHLSETLQKVENAAQPTADQMHHATGILLTPEDVQMIKDEVRVGNKVKVIKHFRNIHGTGLKECKEMVNEVVEW